MAQFENRCFIILIKKKVRLTGDTAHSCNLSVDVPRGIYIYILSILKIRFVTLYKTHQ
jgi:hypothetical protein